MPRPVAIISHPDCILHETGKGHPECSQRFLAIEKALKASPIQSSLHWIEATEARVEAIEAIHSPEYRRFIEAACLKGKHAADFGETTICEDSYRVARLAAGAAVQAVDAVAKGGYQAAMSICRPPGHHARSEQAMGFCLFNNVAIAAAYAQQTYKFDRICIIDWDVHHGNGTQEAFYASPSVLFASLHQMPLYPNSGEAFETGTAAGSGLTLNCPLAPGSAIDHVLDCLNETIAPAIDAFTPQLFFVSAGFDAHKDDPLADINLTAEDFAVLTKWVLAKAKLYAHGKVVSVLEGGYNLQALGDSVASHVQALVESD